MNSRIIVFGLAIAFVFSAGIASALPSPKLTVPFSYEHQTPKTPSLTLTKSASPSTIQVGETTTITIQVENTGTGDAKSVEVTDSGMWGDFDLGEIKSGDYLTCEYTLKVKDSGKFTSYPAIATYNDANGNLYSAASNLVSIQVDVCTDQDGDGWSDEKERRMGTNPFTDDSDRDGLKDPEDPNPTVPEKKIPGLGAVGLLGGLALLALITFVAFILIHNWHVHHGYSYNAILENIFAFLIAISGPILIVGGIILYIGNRSGTFPTFPFAGFITMLLGWLILLFILSTAEN